MRNVACGVAQRREFLATASLAGCRVVASGLVARERRAHDETRERRGFHGLRAELPCRSA
jgi:hypothetical protein